MLSAKLIQFEPLGDQGVLATFRDEGSAHRFVQALKDCTIPNVVDVVLAYVSAAVFFDLGRTDYQTMVEHLRQVSLSQEQAAGSLHEIPCCYERQQDLGRVAEATGMSIEEVIRLHTGTEYVIYAIGFCPGFPYLGYLPPALCGVPRLDKPRLRVESGSVGLTGRQTGIYPQAVPGGWNLIGQTPLKLVDLNDAYFPLRTGDRIRFRRIDEAEFQRLWGERL